MAKVLDGTYKLRKISPREGTETRLPVNAPQYVLLVKEDKSP